MTATPQGSVSLDSVLLEVHGIDKSFPGVHAVVDVSLEVHRSEVVSLVGANGAGKSTLIKIIAGVYQPDDGEILVGGRQVTIGSPKDAERHGISVVHQDVGLSPTLNVYENIFLGHETTRTNGWLLDRAAMMSKARALLSTVGLEDQIVHKPVGSLGIATRQLVAIARALSQNARVVIMDEPTAALAEPDVIRLFSVIKELAASTGMGFLFVSHRLNEVLAISRRAVIMRDGAVVGNLSGAALDRREIVQLMSGREVLEQAAPGVGSHPVGDVVMSIHTLQTRKSRSISLDLHEGEVLGIVGLVGSGRTTLLRALFGLDRATGGEVTVRGQRVPRNDPRAALRAGVAYVPEDRAADGLVQQLNVRKNVSLPNLRAWRRGQLIDFARERTEVAKQVEALSLRPADPEQSIGVLSGGNQQKVVLAKWLAGQPHVLLLDEPTAGVDVATKEQIYGLVRDLAKEGMGIILVSSELPEVLTLSSRMLVLADGEITAEFEHGSVGQQELLRAAIPRARAQRSVAV